MKVGREAKFRIRILAAYDYTCALRDTAWRLSQALASLTRHIFTNSPTAGTTNWAMALPFPKTHIGSSIGAFGQFPTITASSSRLTDLRNPASPICCSAAIMDSRFGFPSIVRFGPARSISPGTERSSTNTRRAAIDGRLDTLEVKI